MAGNGQIRFLRDTGENIVAHKTEKLEPGQPLYNTSKNFLTIGNSDTQVNSAPIDAMRIVGYGADYKNSSGDIEITNSYDKGYYVMGESSGALLLMGDGQTKTYYQSDEVAITQDYNGQAHLHIGNGINIYSTSTSQTKFDTTDTTYFNNNIDVDGWVYSDSVFTGSISAYQKIDTKYGIDTDTINSYTTNTPITINTNCSISADGKTITVDNLDGKLKTKTNAWKSLTNALLEMIYPVGSIYMSVNNTSPASFLGGTWVAWGAGRVPVGVDTSQTEFDAVEETGGAKTHTLTEDEMPKHSHHISTHDRGGGGAPHYSTEGGAITKKGGSGNSTYELYPGWNSYWQQNLGYLEADAVGQSNAHNNLQPYITCYMWKRTA